MRRPIPSPWLLVACVVAGLLLDAAPAPRVVPVPATLAESEEAIPALPPSDDASGDEVPADGMDLIGSIRTRKSLAGLIERTAGAAVVFHHDCVCLRRRVPPPAAGLPVVLCRLTC